MRRMQKWARDWQMLFNVEYVPFMQTRKGNEVQIWQGRVTLERDLGAIMPILEAAD